MTCEEALLAISAALDGELPPRERAKLSEHLVQCESCRALAEDLRVLTDALEDSDREPPAGLAESIRAAVAAEPTARKRRPPYLSTIAAMLALCIGLGGIGLFVSGRAGSGAGSAANGAAPALYQAAPASQAPPAPSEEMEKSAADWDGLSDGTDSAAGYSVTGGGDPAEAPMAAEAPMEAANEEDALPAPSSAPSAMTEARGGGGPTSYGGYDGAGPASNGAGEDGTRMEYAPAGDSMNGEEKLALTPEEALELARTFYAGSAEEADLWTFTWLGLSPNGGYHLFEVRLADSGDYRTILAVSLEDGQVLDKQDSGYASAVEQ